MRMYQGFSECRKGISTAVLFAAMITFLCLISGERALLFAQSPAQRGITLDRWGDIILGQPDFKEVAINETTGDKVWDPGGVLVDDSFNPPRMWVYDTNGRVLGVQLSNPVSESFTYSAMTVIGQPSVNASTCNGDSSFQNGYPAPSASTLCAQNVKQLSITEAPSTVNMALDSQGRLYVPDQWNNRVLVYNNPWSDRVADRVWGQSGFDKGINLAHFGCNRGSGDQATSNTICFQTDAGDGSGYAGGSPGVFVDPWDNLWVADTMNHRVLRFPRGSDGYPVATADVVLGQYSFSGRDTASCMEGMKADGSVGPYDPFLLCRPAAVLVDDAGRVYVADTGYMECGERKYFFGRVVVYEKGSPGWAAVEVWDGKGSWTKGSSDFSGVDPRTGGLHQPSGLAFDPDGDIWVTDTLNNQIALLNQFDGTVLNVLGHSRPTWEMYPTRHPGCGEDTGGEYQNETILSWEGSSGFVELNICDPKGNVGSLSNRDVLVAGNACTQEVYLFPVSRYASDSKLTCRDYDPSYPWYDPDCRPYVGARIFNRTQGCMRNKITPRSLGSGSHRIGYAKHAGQLLVDDSGSIKVWNSPDQISTNWAEPTGVWADHPLERVSGRFFEGTHPYGGLSVDDSQSQDSVWLAMSDGTQRLVLYGLPLGDNPQPLAVLTPPLQVLGGEPLSWGFAPSLAGRQSMSQDGYLWVVDVENNRVFRVRNPRYNPVIDVILGQSTLSGNKCNRGNGTGNAGPGTLCNPGTVNLDYYGNVYVGDHFLENWGNGRILEWDARRFPLTLTQVVMGISADRSFFTEGSFTKSPLLGFCNEVNSYGTCAPMGFAFDENGYLYVGLNPYASQENYYPQVWFNPLGDWQNPPDAKIEDYHSMAMGFTADDHGNVYIHDHNRARIARFDRPWAFQGRAVYAQSCGSYEETSELTIQNPYTSSVTARVIWTLQAKSDGQWKTEEAVITIPAGTTYARSRTESAYNLTDTVVSSDVVSYKSLPITYTSRCLVPNQAPAIPSVNGPSSALVGSPVSFNAMSTDPEAQKVKYTFDWGDGQTSTSSLVASGTSATLNHTYTQTGSYQVKAQATDEAGLSSGWSVPITLSVSQESIIEVVTATTAITYTYLGYSSTYLAEGQSFKAAGPNLVRVTVALAKAGNPAGDIKVSIRSTPKGTDLASATILKSAVTSTNYANPTWCAVQFSNGVPLTKGNTYWVVLSVTSTGTSNYFRVPICSGNPYVNGAWHKGTSLTVNYSYDMLMKLAFGSGTNVAPSQALIESGPSSGFAGVSYTYQAKASDPDGDKVKYIFDWGDGQTSSTALVSSNTSASSSHSWQNSATYVVKVRAEDEHGLQGPWSSSLSVTILPSSNTPPSTPGAVQGPAQGNAGQQLSFSTSATDPNGDRVRIVMDWGDGSQNQSDLVASGTTVSLSHTWAQAGTYQVRAQAVDEKGGSSAWTANKQVQIQPAQTQELIISDNPTNGWYLGSAYSRKRQAQSFQAIGTRIVGVRIALSKVGSPTLPIQVSIRSTLTGTSLASAEIQPSQVTSTDYRYPDWVTVNFATPAQVTNGSGYYLVLATSTYYSTNYYKVGYNSTNPYGYGMYYPDSSSTPLTTSDMACKIIFTN